MLGFKQSAVLDMFKERKRLTIKQASVFYGGNETHTMNAFKTLELKGFIKFKGNGIWELIK